MPREGHSFIGWGDYILGSDQRDFPNVRIRELRMTTYHWMVLACLQGSGEHQNQQYRQGRTTIVSATGGGHQFPRPPTGVQGSQYQQEDKVVLDIWVHVALGRPADCLKTVLPRGPMRPPHSYQILQRITPGGTLEKGECMVWWGGVRPY